MTLTLTQIQADMRDVAFYFHKKSGLPRLKDSGLADVFLGGKGITVKRALSSSLYKFLIASLTPSPPRSQGYQRHQGSATQRHVEQCHQARERCRQGRHAQV